MCDYHLTPLKHKPQSIILNAWDNNRHRCQNPGFRGYKPTGCSEIPGTLSPGFQLALVKAVSKPEGIVVLEYRVSTPLICWIKQTEQTDKCRYFVRWHCPFNHLFHITATLTTNSPSQRNSGVCWQSRYVVLKHSETRCVSDPDPLFLPCLDRAVQTRVESSSKCDAVFVHGCSQRGINRRTSQSYKPWELRRGSRGNMSLQKAISSH